MSREGVIALAVTGVIAIVMIGAFLLGNKPTDAPSAETANIENLKTFELKDRNHVKEPVNYEQVPPAGGNHDEKWADCNGKVYDKPIKNENAVHSLEHGAVWVTYKEEVSKDDLDELKNKVDGKSYIMMSPYPQQPDKIMLTAWNNQISATSAKDDRIDKFISNFSQSPKAPEPGASCTGNAQM